MTDPAQPISQAQARMDAYEQQQRAIEKRAGQICHIVLVMSGKGGVGKSTVAVQLAWSLAMSGQKVGLLDADLHGPSDALMTGTEGTRMSTKDGLMQPVSASGGLKVVSMAMLLEDPDTPTIWRGPLRAGLLRQFIADVDWGTLDWLIVDLPPGTGDEPLTIAQSFPDADGVLIVTTPQKVSQQDCRKAINFAHAVKLPVLGVIENMSGFVCPHCGEHTAILQEGGGQQMAEQMQVPFLGSLPLAPEIALLGDEGKPVGGGDVPDTVSEPFARMVDAIVHRVEETEEQDA